MPSTTFRASLLIAAAALSLTVSGCKREEDQAALQHPTPTTVPTDAAETKVLNIVAKLLNVRHDELHRGTRLKEDLKADDLDQVELVMEIEDTFKISIRDEDAVKLTTIGQVIDYVRSAKPSTSSQ